MLNAKIEKAGVYDLTDREYHSDCCVGPSISASGLKKIISESPADYWRESYLNPQAQTSDEKPHFRIGKAAHMMLLEPDRVTKWISRIPENLLASNGAVSTTEAKEFVAQAVAEGKTPIKPKEWDEIIAMRDALASHPHAKRALMKGRAEVSLILHDEQAQVFVKSRPDFMPEEDGQYIVDYKTVADISRFDKAATIDLRYDMQAALMMWAAHDVLNVDPKGVLYLVQEKKPPFTVGMMAYSMADLGSRAILDVARLDLRAGLNKFAECLDCGVWPNGYETPREIAAPGWHMKSVEKRLEDNTTEFPNAFAA